MSENNALGVMSLADQLISRAIHPKQTWIDGWNFDPASQYIRGRGDLDGDGRDEFVIISDWGIGLLKHEGDRFRCLFAAPRDTWFGGWRYDATINPGRDRIMDVQDFTHSAKRELLVWSSWGMTTLEFTGSSFTPTRIHANGVRLGGWVLNTADNWYAGSGRFDSDSCHDMVLTSPWGLGLISLQAGTSIFMAANGSRLGDWQLNSRSDRVSLIADFDGDGRDEIVIEGRRGIAVLKMVENRLTSIAVHEFGANLGGYLLGSTDNFVLADRFQGAAAQILVVSPTSGLHILRLQGNRLERQAFAANGTRIDGWVIDAVNNTVQAVGDMTGDGAADFVIRSPWGVGIMSLDTTNRIRCRTLQPYGAPLGEWLLESSDMIASGQFTQTDRSELLVVKPWVNSERRTRFTTRDFTNWHGNIVRRSIQTVQPKSLAELVTAVKTIQERGHSVGIMGSGWSFTDCAVGSRTEVVIDTSSLSAILGGLVPDILDARPTMNGANRLVHVEAGVKLFDLNCKLETLGLALPTMGGSRGQSLAGVLSTGVHGADVNLPPIADAVRAIHLVGPNGQQWWIEPAIQSVSTRSILERAKARGILDPSIKNVYDNDWFNAALVAVGCAGVIYSVVLECRPAFRLSSTTFGETWTQAQQRIQDLAFPSRRPRYLEINVNPADQSCRVTVREETTEAERPPTGGGGMSMCETIAALGFIGPAALGLFLGAIGDYVARTSAEIVALKAIPVPGLGEYLAGKKMLEALKPVEDAHRLLVELNLVAIDPHNPRRVADVLPTALNLIWAIGAFVVSGRTLVDQLQRELTLQQRPDQSWVGKSFRVMTGQPNCSESGVQNHDEVARLVESYEYAVPANRAIAFIDRLTAVIADLRRQQDAIVVNLNLRFTGRTRATLGMQLFEQTCHVEIYTFRGLRGNEVFKQRMQQIVREFNAVPHWGQFHNREEAAAFGSALERWRRVMQSISSGNELGVA